MTYETDIERLNYYEGEFLGAVDFQAEQEYHRDMRRRHNLGQHTWGIVTGLDLAQAPNGGMDGSTAEVDVYLQPGMAVDGFGREIVVLSQAQLTPEMFAAFYNPSANANPIWMYVWISYQEALLQPPEDACASSNVSNAYSRIQETYTLTVTAAGAPPVNNAIVVDGSQTTPPVEPTSSSSSSGSSGSTAQPDPPLITLPYDNSVPFQEFSTDDSSLVWWIALGRVMWDPHNEVFLQINSDPVQAAASAGVGREYVGNISATLYAPAGSYTIVDRNSPYPAPPSASDPNLGGVQAEVAGSLQVDYLLNAEMNVLIGGSYSSSSPVPLSPLTIIASGTNEELIQFRNPMDQETWHICENLNGNNPGINFGQITAAGATEDGLLFIQSGGNVGVGTLQPQQNLSVGAAINLDQAEANTGKLNPGLSFGSNSGEGISSNRQAGGTNADGIDFYTGSTIRMSIAQGGNVGIGVTTPEAELQISGGQWDVTNTAGDLQIGNSSMSLKIGVALGGAGAGDARIRAMGGTNRLMIGTGIDDTVTIVNGQVGISTTTPQQDLSVNGALNIDQGNQNTGSGLNPGLSFGSSSGEGIASQRTGTNQYGLNFYTGSTLRMSIASNVNGGGVSVTGSLNVDQANQNTGSGVNPGLTFGASSGEGIASQRTGPNEYDLNFYTGFDLRMSIASNAEGGGVSMTGSLTVGGDITVNGNRSYLLGVDGANYHWIMAGGTTEGPDNAIGFNPSIQQITIGSSWDLWVDGTLHAPTKVGCVADRFINRDGIKLERGDVVVLHSTPCSQYYGPDGKIPIAEVQYTDIALDTRVCGIVDEPALADSKIGDLDRTKLGDVQVGLMVTLGAYAFCKVDADIAPISPGDLLTTSPTAGYAQKLDPEAPAKPGAVIGKALGSLTKGKGTIPLLVSHQ